MTSERPGEGREARLRCCMRDLAALTALPSMCVGRSRAEALDIVCEALPTALSSELVYLELDGPKAFQRATWRGERVVEPALTTLRLALPAEDAVAVSLMAAPPSSCLSVELPIGRERGRLVIARGEPFDPETDRVLVRSAANLVGMILETATVLESARRKDDFLAVLGHELRNPLAPILTAAELLAREPTVSREQKVIDRNTRHLARLVDDLLDISRVTRGQVELCKEHVTVRAVLERAVEIAAPFVARGGHELRIGDPGDAAVLGDPVRLAQVFGNLLVNAAKFTSRSGTIEVTVDRRPALVRVSVRDSGRGIARSELTKIFEPFVQIDRRRDQLSGGLGLGLAIVHDLVTRHGGVISAESEGLGHGSTFRVELPTVNESAPTVGASRGPAADARRGVRVLVVDDNTDIAELLSDALGRQGFQTDVALDGRGALDRWRAFAPHIGILDVGLPDVDGYELARTIRREHGADPMLIAATGYGRPQDRRMSADAGFDCHLVKPVSVRELVRVLDERVLAGAPGPLATGLAAACPVARTVIDEAS